MFKLPDPKADLVDEAVRRIRSLPDQPVRDPDESLIRACGRWTSLLRHHVPKLPVAAYAAAINRIMSEEAAKAYNERA